MSSMGTASAVALLKHLFHNDAIANLGDATGVRGSTVAGSVYVSLHTAAPAGAQNDDETSYGDYARQAVARSAAKWPSTDTPDGSDQVFVVNADDILFPSVASGTPTITHASIGVAVSGASLRLFSAELDAPIVLGPGDVPKLAAGALKIYITVDDA